MPILNVKISGKPSQDMSQRVASFLLELTTRVLRKKPELTAVSIEYVAHDDWFIGGKSLSQTRKNSFYFDIKITDETNTKDEKAQYIKNAFEGFERILGNLHEESYIFVHDVKAAAYGFGGKTQEFRYQHEERKA